MVLIYVRLSQRVFNFFHKYFFMTEYYPFFLFMFEAEKEPKGLSTFLKKENHILREENKELKDLLELNREALRASVQFKKG